MTAVSLETCPACLETDKICDSRKFASKTCFRRRGHPAMCQVERAGCEILRGSPLIRRLLLRVL